MEENLDGIILINKEINMTSRDVVNIACKKFQTKKIGHTGTLDPFASGLLVLTINKATKIASFIEATTKKYIGELTLGIATDTYDLSGKVVEKQEVKKLTKEDIEEVFKTFIGEIKQIPPLYSAIKYNGEPLYKLARQGKEVPLKERTVTIYDLKLLSLTNNRILFEVTCSKGTYIRSLGCDIAKKLNTCGHLSLLTRIEVGNFKLKDAKLISEISSKDIIPIKDALSFMNKVIVSDLEKKVINGMKISLNITDEKVLILNKQNKALAIYVRHEDGFYYCLRGLN